MNLLRKPSSLLGKNKNENAINHFVPLDNFEAQYEKALAAIEELSPEMDFHFDVYPSLFTMFPIYTFLPKWAQNDVLSHLYIIQKRIGWL